MTTAYQKLEVPATTKCYVYPFIENKLTNEIQYLMREHHDTNSGKVSYEDFGGDFDASLDGNMLQGLARSLLMKSYGLISTPQSFKVIKQEQDVADVVSEFEYKLTQDSIIHNGKMNEVYKTLTDKNTIKVVKGNAIFISFQMSEVEINLINDYLKKNNKQQFSYVPLEQLSTLEVNSDEHIKNLTEVQKLAESHQTYRQDFNIQSNSTDYSSQHGSVDQQNYENNSDFENNQNTNLNSDNLESLQSSNQDDLPEYAVIVYDERDHYFDMYEMLFMGNFIQDGNEKWAFYKAYNFELPSEKVLANLKGLVLPGSKYSVYDETIEWINPLKEFVQNVYNNYKQIKMIGICFGHQLIAHSLGGKTEKMIPRDEYALYVGKEEITLKDSFYEIPAVKQVMKEFGLENTRFMSPLILNAVHQDHVITPPPNAIVHGSSVRTDVELYTIEDRVFTFQAHPEFSEHQMKEFVCKRLLRFGLMTEERSNKLISEFNDERLVNRQFILNVLRTFIKTPIA